MNLQWLYTMRRPEHEKVAPPIAVRRWAAVIAVVAYPVTLGVLALDLSGIRSAVGVVPVALLMIVPVVLWVGAVAVVYDFRRRLAQAPDEQLDERERAIRDEAYLISYRILGGLLALIGLVVLGIVPMFLDDRTISLDLVLNAFSSLTIMAVSLPSAVVAWRDTEVDHDDDVLAEVA